jgi:hypothetical protein
LEYDEIYSEIVENVRDGVRNVEILAAVIGKIENLEK